VAVRLRRDFTTVLSLIRAHALLHRATREIANDIVMATMADYAVVRELVSDLVSDGVEQTVSDSVRTTVEKVAELTIAGGETTVIQIAAGIGIDKSSASRRVRSATERGYLRNLEDRRGRPARLVLGDPLPADMTILPTVDELERLHGCSGGGGGTNPGRPEPENRSDRDVVCEAASAVPMAIEDDYPRSAWDPDAGANDPQAEMWLAAPLTSSGPGGGR